LIIFIQQAVSAPFWKEQSYMDKRRIDGHGRASIPLFRGSNLGIFVRKRPFTMLSEHAAMQRKDIRTPLDTDDNNTNEYLYKDNHQRRFDDYADSPASIFGR
jgi:hypothetical protein